MLQTLTMLFFSPTGGTLRAARLLAQGLAEEITEVDLSLPQGKAMHSEVRPSALPFWPVTNPLLRPKAPLESPGLPTGPGRSRCGSSSTVWARMPPRSSAGSTASPMCRLSSTTTPAP